MLDLRFPIGLFFSLNAAILLVVGILSPRESQLGSIAFNLNLVWGLVMAAFGALMLALARLDKGAKKSAGSEPPSD